MISHRPLTIFVPHCSDLLTDHRPHGDALIAHGFIHRLAERGHEIYVAANEVDLRKPLPENVHVIPLRTSSGDLIDSRIAYMRRVRQLFFEIKARTEVDIIHQMNPVFTGISLALLGAGVPVVLGTYVARWPSTEEYGDRTFLGLNYDRIARTMIAAAQQQCADQLVLTAPAAANRFPAARLLRDKMTYLSHGVDGDHFSPAGAETAEPDGTVLFLANVSRKKGIFDLLQAFPIVLAEHPEAHLLVAGSGPDLAQAKDLADALGIRQRVTFLGHKDRSALPELYRNCSVYCLPSIGEPYATSVLEAMSCGKPIVYTNAGGLPHMVGNEGGVAVRVGDVNQLACALGELLRNPELRRTMGEHNRRRVLDTMTWERVIDRLEGIYRHTIETRERRAGVLTSAARRQPESAEDLA